MGYFILFQFLMGTYFLVGQQVYMPLNWIQFNILYCLDVAKLNILHMKKYEVDLSISCVKNFKINQHNFFPPCFFCSIFHKKTYVANVDEKVYPFSSIIQIVILEYLSFMNTWQNIPPHHQILYPMCQIIFSKYFVNINRIFKKRFFHAHLLMFARS